MSDIYDFSAHQQIAELREDIARLQEGSKTNTTGQMATDSDTTDLKIAASEARSETKLARLEGKLDLLAQSISVLSGKIDSQRTEASSNRNVIVATVLASLLAFAALIYALMAYGASTFYNGTVVRDLVHNETSQQLNNSPARSGK